MERCLVLAQQAKTKGHTAVGALIVRGQEIIAEGQEGEEALPDMMSHAENIAILKASQRLNSTTLDHCRLYTTVEPCFMCSYLIRQTQLEAVIYGTTTPAGGDSSPYPILKAQDIGPWSKTPIVTAGILQAACEALLKK